MADLITQGKCLFYELPSLDLRELQKPPLPETKAQEIGAGLQGEDQEPPHRPVLPRDGCILQLWRRTRHRQVVSRSGRACRTCLSKSSFAWSLPGTEESNREDGLREIHKKAASSIGCAVHPSVAFEAGTLLEGLRQLHADDTGDGQEDCGGMQEVPRVPLSLDHPRLRTRHLCKGTRGSSAIPTDSRTTGRCSKRQDSIFLPTGAEREPT